MNSLWKQPRIGTSLYSSKVLSAFDFIELPHPLSELEELDVVTGWHRFHPVCCLWPIIDVCLECHVEKDSEAKSGFTSKETVID